MKKSKAIFVLLLPLISTLELESQQLFLNFESGLGNYRMKDIKMINYDVMESLPFEAKYTSYFPAYFYYKPSLVLSINKFINIGVAGSFHSTGSLISRKDYSGEYYFETRIKTTSPGIIIEFFYPVGKSRIYLTNEVGINYTELHLEEYLELYEESELVRYRYYGTNHYYYPSLRFSYPLFFFRVGISAGYLLDFRQGNLQYSENMSIILRTKTGIAYADWSGFRAGLSLSMDLLKKSKKNK